MSNIRRYYEENAVYNITCNTYSRQPIFKEKKAAAFLMNILGYYKIVLKFNLYCYCIMPDHLHIIIQPRSAKYNISEIMRHIKGSFARAYNNLIRKNGIIWQRRFFDTILQTEEEFLTRLNYILQNPVRAGIMNEAKEYPYSSARVYFEDEDDYITDRYISK